MLPFNLSGGPPSPEVPPRGRPFVKRACLYPPERKVLGTVGFGRFVRGYLLPAARLVPSHSGGVVAQTGRAQCRSGLEARPGSPPRVSSAFPGWPGG